MNGKNHAWLRGIWALAWRSVVYLPVMLGAFFLLLCLVIAMLLPPIIGAIFLFYGLWWQAIVAFVFWVFIIWAWRHYRLARYFEFPSSPM